MPKMSKPAPSLKANPERFTQRPKQTAKAANGMARFKPIFLCRKRKKKCRTTARSTRSSFDQDSGFGSVKVTI